METLMPTTTRSRTEKTTELEHARGFEGVGAGHLGAARAPQTPRACRAERSTRRWSGLLSAAGCGKLSGCRLISGSATS